MVSIEEALSFAERHDAAITFIEVHENDYAMLFGQLKFKFDSGLAVIDVEQELRSSAQKMKSFYEARLSDVALEIEQTRNSIKEHSESLHQENEILSGLTREELAGKYKDSVYDQHSKSLPSYERELQVQLELQKRLAELVPIFEEYQSLGVKTIGLEVHPLKRIKQESTVTTVKREYKW